jgi:hypothetical protein
MSWTPPPQDPNERLAEAWDLELAQPTAWFASGDPSPAARLLADKILVMRPGALVVFDTP